ncbi:MarR family winged helix-turn-helix transcriptional regulator [Arthrobacter gengyunqii]|uniref:MarR family winged helix-turn-helix transcriptional regulator n=1 Tax=Arthrobacter gengyunqii TaxID=2886940 RepID=A0A9X1LZH9_9MICC|nr:MarR family winged helix-turn-helix transcriptional regulator [Arthrobacter gengyunqii]MCC3265780.1 MarR family winged helix-turn-helix transcriptional regulator [Arthrobacter gengyunqii]MCC3268518.1 MarR family winged helix-turn-helix transcriptional regulator [Arthrobacter gengyunqii]UOY95905.1 MarR family winged helix-turn-helix transcriptional regulator [Arthrobacter gengyunqii]
MQNEGDWEAVRLLSTAARLVRREIDNRLRGIGLTQERVTVLRVLDTDGPMKRAELARRLRVTAQTLGTSLVTMSRQGLVGEVPLAANGSRRAVSISEHGRKMLGRADDIERSGFSAAIRPELRQELIGLIRELEVRRTGASARI